MVEIVEEKLWHMDQKRSLTKGVVLFLGIIRIQYLTKYLSSQLMIHSELVYQFLKNLLAGVTPIY